jgi:quinol monooxygenase YgiN
LIVDGFAHFVFDTSKHVQPPRKEGQMTATFGSTDFGLTEVQLFRVGGDDGETKALLQALERSTHALAAEPGFLTASQHVSDDATIVIWRQWADDASWRASRTNTSRQDECKEVQRHIAQCDIAAYKSVYVNTASGGPFSIEANSRVATLIDVMVTDPTRQGATLDFNIANPPAACTSGSGSSAEP